MIQSSFPQGSILVVPHTPGSFQTVLPVFANTAVIMPQGGTLTSSPSVSSVSASDSTSLSQSATAVTLTAGSPLPANAVANMTTLSSQPTAAAIAIDGRLLGLSGASMSTTGAGGAQMMKLVQQAMASAGAGGGGGVIAATAPMIQGQMSASPVAKKGGSANEKKPANSTIPEANVPQVLQGTVFPPQVSMPFSQMFLTAAGMTALPQIYTMKVEEPVQVGKVSLESTSIELTGQVPLKKIDTKTMTVIKTDEKREETRSSQNVVVITDKDEKGGAEEKVEEKKAEDGAKKPAEEKVVGDEQEKEDSKEKEGEGMKDQKKEEKDKREVKNKEDTKQGKGKGDTVTGGFHGHSSADLMSAELLLSLTGGGTKDWPISPSKKGARNEPPALVTSSPNSGDTHTPSSGRKRKQKPIASAKPPQATPEGKTEVGGKTGGSPALPKAKRVRKPKKDEGVNEEEPAKRKTAKEKAKDKDKEVVVRKSKQFTPQELLEILNIPPSTGGEEKGGMAKAPGKG